ncbi:MAG: hypothetical protein SV186_05330 [Candidatus Nanohaloarchaea archaeon]|nr:hypothetical protein [Candidatus Nanohaloarchaea archaeon]
MPSKQEVRQRYRELINQGQHKDDLLNYVVAVSSGLNVVNEIPDEAYKRAAWAANQGASFIEVSIGGPSQIYNEWDDLLAMSRQLGLSYDCHFPVKVPFDYSNPYREQREEIGYFYGHEFMYKFIKAWGEFKQAMESQTDVNGDQQHVYGINSHLVKSTIPAMEERMAGSVSVDPFGEDIMESRIFQNQTFRVGFFKDYLWEEQFQDNFNLLQSIASDIEGFTDYQVIFRREIIDYMSDNGYLDNGLLEAVSNIDDADQIKDNLKWLKDNRPDLINLSVRQAEMSVGELYEDEIAQAEQEQDEERYQELQERVEELRGMINDGDHAEFLDELDDLDAFLDSYIQKTMSNIDMYRSSAIQNIAGVRTDVPDNLDDLKEHREGQSVAQNMPRFDPELHSNARWVHLIPKEFWELDDDEALRDQADFQNVMDAVVENVKQELKDAMVERLENEETYDGHREYMQNLNRELSVGEVAFRDIINFRSGQFRDNMSRESVIYWYVLPYWMPFSDNDRIRSIWDDITGIESSQYSRNNIDDFKEALEDLKESEHYDRIVAAGAGAYVWGHFTQVTIRGQEKPFVQLLDEYGLTMDWESHNVGNQGNGKLWKPHDIIKVCRAINNTPVNGETHEVMFCTIDMEHLAMNGVDPLWLIEGNDEKGYRGLDEGDGRMITKQHITHPALSETGHHHQPIRRGDTLVYRHLEALVDVGFAQREDRPAVVMYELGEEKAESTFMLRLMLNMLEKDIRSDDLESHRVDEVWERYDQGKDIELEDYMILKFFGLTDEEWHHEWQEIHEHALDPLDGLLEMETPDKTFSGERPIQQGTQPDKWEEEEYR